MDIQITKTQDSKLKNIDFDNIPFGKHTSDHMFVMDYKNGQWNNFRIIPYQGFTVDPHRNQKHCNIANVFSKE